MVIENITVANFDVSPKRVKLISSNTLGLIGFACLLDTREQTSKVEHISHILRIMGGAYTHEPTIFHFNINFKPQDHYYFDQYLPAPIFKHVDMRTAFKLVHIAVD